MILDESRQHEAWTNLGGKMVHAFGCERPYDRLFNRTRQVGRCQITVYDPLGEPFNPDDPRACPECVEGYRRGLSMSETVALRPKATVTICGGRKIR